MEKLSLGYEVLKEANPSLIYTAISGFGHTGPDSSRPAYDILVQAMGGIVSITGWPDSPPTRVGMSTGDIIGALYGTIDICTAIFQRERTGEGQKIDISMLNCQVAILENALSRFQVEGVAPEVGENGAQILRDLLGHNDDDIAILMQEQVIAIP